MKPKPPPLERCPTCNRKFEPLEIESSDSDDPNVSEVIVALAMIVLGTIGINELLKFIFGF